MKETDKKFGFILKDGSDYGIIFGESVYFLRDGICDICEDVEVGFDKSKILDGYSFGINKLTKTWRIRDTGHKNCKHMLKTGKYGDGFEESLEPFMRIFK